MNWQRDPLHVPFEWWAQETVLCKSTWWGGRKGKLVVCQSLTHPWHDCSKLTQSCWPGIELWYVNILLFWNLQYFNLFVTLPFSPLCSYFSLFLYDYRLYRHPESLGDELCIQTKLLKGCSRFRKPVWCRIWHLPTGAKCNSSSLCKSSCPLRSSQPVPCTLWAVRILCPLLCPSAWSCPSPLLWGQQSGELPHLLREGSV